VPEKSHYRGKLPVAGGDGQGKLTGNPVTGCTSLPKRQAYFWALRDMPKSVPKDMSKQFRVYIVPSDIQSTLDHLRSKVGLRVLEETAPGPKPIEVESPVRRRSTWIKARDYVSVRCYLVPDCSADIKMYYIPKQSHWIVHSEDVEGIEFSGCDYDGKTLLEGRFYFRNDMLIGDTIWPKRREFLDWADKVFRITKKQLRWSKELDAYIGKGAENFMQNGGKFATRIRPDGEPAYVDE
jgi:hypothetical protein